jgi:hypothetical protein
VKLLKPYSRTYSCQRCGCDFRVDSSEFSNGVIQPRKYCDKSCRIAAKHDAMKEARTCENPECQSPFMGIGPRAKWCSPRCRSVRNQRVWREKTWARRDRLYKLRPGQFDAMHARQDGRCAICRKPETAKRNGRIKSLAVDHCHKTGTVRSLLCGRCNLLLGNLFDDLGIFDNFLEYMVFHKFRDSVDQKIGWNIECPSLYRPDELT